MTVSEIPQLTGDELRAFRTRFGLPQAAFATLLGVSSRTVEEWESERSNRPPMLRLALAAVAADLHPWRHGSLCVREVDGNFYVEIMPRDLASDLVDSVAARPFGTREAAEAFKAFWEGADTCWDGRPYPGPIRRFSLMKNRGS